MLRTLGFTMIVVLALPAAAHADRRSFARTYEYMTMPEAGLELELYNTQSTAELDDDSASAFKSQIELEYGITSHWDVSLYQVFEQSSNPADPTLSEPLHYAETKLRTRYRFAERGEWPLDTLLYFEVVKVFGVMAWELEPKLILARDFGPITAAVNAIAKIEITSDESKFTPGWAFGVTYEIAPSFKVGAESFGEIELDPSVVEAFVGPSVSWAPAPHFWTTVNAGFGLTDDSDAFTVQAIIGVGIR